MKRIVIKRKPATPEDASRLAALEDLRIRHGFPRETARRASGWSRTKIDTDRTTLIAGLRAELGDSSNSVPPAQANEWPRNRELLDLLVLKFRDVGFGWSRGERIEPTRTRQWINFHNYPTVGGEALTLADMALMSPMLADGYAKKMELDRWAGAAPELRACRQRMEATGIAYKGLGGVSWLMATQAVRLPKAVRTILLATAQAIFHLFDAVGELFNTDEELRRLLTFNKSDRIPALVGRGRMDFIRPDIVLSQHPETKALLPVITELESAPAGHGMAHAMLIGYGLPDETIDAFVRYLDGRRYLVVATREWSEYVFDQAAFCRALHERGVEAAIIFDGPLEEIDRVARRDWHKPSQLDPRLTWNPDFLGRLRRSGLLEFVHGEERMPRPDELDERTVVFRFGYLDNLVRTAGLLDRMTTWAERGATIINPPSFFLESKVLMAAAGLPAVQAWLRKRAPEAVGVLKRSLAETRLLADGFSDIDEFRRDQSFWLTKFAGWDGNNQSWGARSLLVGAETSVVEWERSLQERMALPHPVVVQHYINSGLFKVSYVAPDGNVATLEEARSRLTPFFIRQTDGTVELAGSVITLRHSRRVHGASDAVEAPVDFADEEG